MAEKKPQKKEADDFRYLVRLASTDLDGHKSLATGLATIKGVSHRLSVVIAAHAGIDRSMKVGNLSDAQIEKLVKALEEVADYVPEWLRNRQNDVETGEDLHLIGSEIDIQLREDLNRLKKIRSWRGVRHEKRLPVRGQRTKNNGRTGMTVGVQRKKV
jgi:small subunit ribosomal protein S13